MVSVPFVRSPYNYDMAEASDESGLCCEDGSLTKQSFAEEANINTIVRRFGVTGELPVGVRAPIYGDFSNVVDYHSAMTALAQARESFEKMPAEVRARFDNDPSKFVDFCSDDNNRVEAEKLGLVVPKAAELVGGSPAVAGTQPPASGAPAVPSETPRKA